MISLDALLDIAKSKNNLTSDRHLGRAIGVTPPVICSYRTGRSIPSDETVIKLCEITGFDPEQTLLEFAAMRTTGKAATTYLSIARKLSATAASLILIGLLSLPSPSHAGQSSCFSAQNFILWKILKRLLTQCLHLQKPIYAC